MKLLRKCFDSLYGEDLSKRKIYWRGESEKDIRRKKLLILEMAPFMAEMILDFLQEATLINDEKRSFLETRFEEELGRLEVERQKIHKEINEVEVKI